MATLRERLPPANALVVFEAVARHENFTRAAAELQVTQAAVSRQVQILEDHLGVRLFTRLHRRVELTVPGRELREAVTIGLSHIARVADDVRGTNETGDITVSCSVTFASYWLMSRIAKFRAEFSDVDIRMVASAKVRDLAATGIDLAVRYGRGDWSDVTAKRLFGDRILPVAAPDYVKSRGPFDSNESMSQATFLHLSKFDRNWVTWEHWFEEFGVKPEGKARHLYFDNYTVLMHAAVRGEGLALCGGRLAEDFIQRGELCQPIPQTLDSEFSFYLLYPDAQRLRPHAKAFRDWLLKEAHGSD
jgi:LysR family transcriptional regulator, glycine cleavage system transcriptional activator